MQQDFCGRNRKVIEGGEQGLTIGKMAKKKKNLRHLQEGNQGKQRSEVHGISKTF